MLKIAVCDDTPFHLQSTVELVEKTLPEEDVSVWGFSGRAALLSGIRDGLQPNIAILDIELGTDSGIDLATDLNRLLPKCQIIFLTSFPQYASDVYVSKHTWFIMKNQIERYMPAALSKAIACAEGNETPSPTLLAKHHRTLLRIPVSDILFLERITYRTRIVTFKEEFFTGEKPVVLLAKLSESPFIRCHQSYWVNGSNIFSQSGYEFHLIGGKTVPISRTYKASAIEAFSKLRRNG